MYIITVGLVVFLAAFVWGYREGLSQGRLRGLSEAPLDLRIKLATHSECPICDASYKEGRDCASCSEV